MTKSNKTQKDRDEDIEYQIRNMIEHGLEGDGRAAAVEWLDKHVVQYGICRQLGLLAEEANFI
jgi:hypothetical protein